MRLVHRSGPPTDRQERTLATDIEITDTMFSRMRGLMFRREPHDDFALIFRFDRPRPRTLHMMFVFFAIDALWISGTEVTQKRRLKPFVGLGRGTGDTVIELPAGVAEDVEPGDNVELIDDDS